MINLQANRNVAVQHLWIIQEGGLCLVQESFVIDSSKKLLDESLVGGFIAAIFSFSQSFSGSNIEAMALGSMSMYYATSNNLITCLGVDKKTKEKSVMEALTEIHQHFIDDYAEFLGSGSLPDTSKFENFKAKYYEALGKHKLFPKGYKTDVPVSIGPAPAESKITQLVRELLIGGDVESVSKEIKGMFATLKGKQGKEFRKLLMDFDKFVRKTPLSKPEQDRLISLLRDLRSFAAIDEFLSL